jgi:methionyl-tRNA formyltransferase
MQKKARIVFAGSPEFAVSTLAALLASQHEVVAVLTQPDRPAGRGRSMQPGPVKIAALNAGVPVLQPVSLKETDVQGHLRELEPDLMVVVAYGMLLPEAVLTIPAVGCINVHASLLPRWRGASPIQAAILAGDVETGVSIMQMDVGLDTGPVYCMEKLTIGVHETAGELHDRLAALGGKLLEQILDPVLAGKLRPVAQSAEGITYAGRINKADGQIDWTKSAVEINHSIHAYNPWPVAQTSLAGEQLRCWASCVADQPVNESSQSNLKPGKVLGLIDAGIEVQTGSGVLVLTEVQAPGRKRIAARDFANAHALEKVILGQ